MPVSKQRLSEIGYNAQLARGLNRKGGRPRNEQECPGCKSMLSTVERRSHSKAACDRMQQERLEAEAVDTKRRK